MTFSTICKKRTGLINNKKCALAIATTMLCFASVVQALPLKPQTKEQAPAQPKKISIQAAMVQECIDQATTLKMTDAKSASKVCNCTIGVQASKLTLGEFWAIQSAAASGENPNELKALQRIQPALDSCHKGITLNKPQFPQTPAKK